MTMRLPRPYKPDPLRRLVYFDPSPYCVRIRLDNRTWGLDYETACRLRDELAEELAALEAAWAEPTDDGGDE